MAAIKKMNPFSIFYRNVQDYNTVLPGKAHVRPSETKRHRFFILLPNQSNGIYIDRLTATALRDRLSAALRLEAANPVAPLTVLTVTDVTGKTVEIPVPAGVVPVSARITTK